MNYKKRILSILLSLVLLTGCGANESISAQESSSTVDEFGIEATPIVQAKTMDVYCKQELTTRSDIQHLFLDGDTIYFSTETEIYRLVGDTETLLCSAYVPITCFAVSGDDIWYVAGTGESTEDGYQEDYALIHNNGIEEISYSLADIPDYLGGGANDILLTTSGEIWLQLVASVAVLNENGNLIHQITSDQEWPLDRLLESDSGQIFGSSSFVGAEVYSVSVDGITPHLSLSYTEFPGGISFPGMGDTDFFLVNNTGLYCCISGTVTQTAKWADSGLSFLEITEMYPMSDGSFILLDSGKLFMLSTAAEEDVTPSQVIEIAVDMMQSTLSDAVDLFNASNTAYHVELTQYFNGNDGREKGMDRLKLELASGEGPDIIGISRYSMDLSTIESYGNNGYLVDINTFLSADSETASDLSILSALESHERLYYVTEGYFIQTALGLTSQWGDTTGWTFDEYETLLDNNGSVFRYMSPEMFLSCSFYALENQFIDFESGICQFDSEEFINLLELSRKQDNTLSLRTEDDESGYSDEFFFLASVQALASRADLRSISDFATTENQVGQELSIIGWPNLDGSCGSSIAPNHLFAINANSQYQEGAWEFLKFLMTDEQVQAMIASERGFPVSTKALNAAAEQAVSGVSEMGYDAATEAQVDKVRSLISQISAVYSEDSIFNIVNEETEAFFAGDTTAEETAQIIQNRVQIYLSEQS